MKKVLQIVAFLTILLFLPIHILCSEKPPQEKTILSSPAAQFVTSASCYLAEQSASAVVWFLKSSVTYVTAPHQGQQPVPSRVMPFSRKKTPDCDDSDASSINSNSDSEEEDLDTVMIPLENHTNRSFYRNQDDLQKALINNPNSAINKLNKMLQHNFDNIETTQEDIQYMFKLLEESSSSNDKKPLAVAPIIADQYKNAQRALLIARIQTHADKLAKNKTEYETSAARAESKKGESIAKAEKKCSQVKEKAKKKYDSQVKRSLTSIKIIAENSAFLNKSATEQENHPAYQQDIFNTQESYVTFMARQLKQEAKQDHKKKK